MRGAQPTQLEFVELFNIGYCDNWLISNSRRSSTLTNTGAAEQFP
ncbi:hypothetical protein ABZ820_18230 [Streptomyces diacarni]